LLYRIITAIASILVAILLAAISFGLAGVVVGHIQNQTPNAAATPLALTIVATLLALVFAIPTMRKNLLVRSYNTKGRILFILLCTGIIAGIAYAGATVLRSDIPINIPKALVPPIGGGILVLFFLTFIFPGFAFLELRDAKRKIEVFSDPSVQRHIVPQQMVIIIPHYQQSLVSRILRPLLWMFALLFIAVGLYGAISARFLPTGAHSDWVAEKLAVLVALPVGVLAALVFFSKPEAGKGMFGAALMQNLAIFLLLATGIGAVAKPFFTSGYPDILSYLTNGEQGSQTVVLQEFDKGICNNNASVAYTGETQATVTVCDIPEALRGTVAKGDRLTITGEQTPYGLHYTGISKTEIAEETETTSEEQPSNP